MRNATAYSLPILMLAVVGCSETESTSPVLSDLVVYPSPFLSSQSSAIIRGTVTFEDPDGDLQMLHSVLRLPNEEAQTLPTQPILNSEGIYRGSVDIAITTQTTVGEFTVELWVSDKKGNVSNRLTETASFVAHNTTSPHEAIQIAYNAGPFARIPQQ